MGSLDGLNRPEPNPFLFARIRHELSNGQTAGYVPARLVWAMGASFAVLTLLNWQLITGLKEQKNQAASELNTVITDMKLMPATNQLYGVWSELNY